MTLIDFKISISEMTPNVSIGRVQDRGFQVPYERYRELRGLWVIESIMVNTMAQVLRSPSFSWYLEDVDIKSGLILNEAQL